MDKALADCGNEVEAQSDCCWAVRGQKSPMGTTTFLSITSNKVIGISILINAKNRFNNFAGTSKAMEGAGTAANCNIIAKSGRKLVRFPPTPTKLQQLAPARWVARTRSAPVELIEMSAHRVCVDVVRSALTVRPHRPRCLESGWRHLSYSLNQRRLQSPKPHLRRGREANQQSSN